MPASWHDPHPAEGDVTLALAAGIDLAFRSVPIDTRTLYGDVTFRMGSTREQLFEAPVDVRISSPISGADGRRQLLIGKYEITKAQYAYVMGAGDPQRGLELLAERSGERRVGEALAAAGSCKGVTPALRQILAEPVTYLGYSDYVAFLEAANSACIASPACAEAMRGFSANREVIAFLRLPLEHEWEYIARRGGALADGQIGRNAMQADLPDFGAGLSLADVAHLGREPDRVKPIGAHRPVDGLYDVFGNAAELMQNAFTSEIGYGAVGGYVARGGHYRLAPADVRVSMRSELLPFRVDDDTGEIASQRFQFVGLRLALALPVAGSATRSGSDELADEFAEAFTELGTSRDIGGDNIGEAGDLGIVTDSGITLRDRLSDEDRQDFMRVTLGVPARLELELTGAEGAELELLAPDGRVIGRARSTRPSDGGASLAGLAEDDLLPGPLFIRVARMEGGEVVDYRLRVTRTPSADTGIPYPTTSILGERAPDAQLAGPADSLSIRGYVGTGDISDFYVLVNTSAGADRRESLAVTVSAPDPAQITLRVLDEDLRITAEARVQPDGKVPPLPFPPDSVAFLQIEAPETTVQPYSLEASLSELDARYPRSQAEAAAAPAFARGQPFEGLIGLSGREAHFRIEVRERARVRVELSGFGSDLDLRLRNANGADMSRQHLRQGLESEVFTEDLEPGSYFLRVAMKNPRETTAFRLSWDQSAPEITRPLTLAEAMRKPLGVIAGDGQLLGQEMNGIAVVELRKSASWQLKVDVGGFAARSNIDIRAVDVQGNVLATSSNSGATPEEMLIDTPKLRVFLILEAMGDAPLAGFDLRVKQMQTQSRWAPPAGATVISSHGDWTVYTEGQFCYAATGWSTISPAGERLFARAPGMVVRYTKGNSGVFFVMLESDSNTDTGRVTLEVEVSGRMRAGKYGWDGVYLKPTVVQDGKTYVDSATMGLFTAGTSVRLAGTHGGKSYDLRYSLRGYSDANRAANRHCGADAAWVVQ